MEQTTEVKDLYVPREEKIARNTVQQEIAQREENAELKRAVMASLEAQAQEAAQASNKPQSPWQYVAHEEIRGQFCGLTVCVLRVGSREKSSRPHRPGQLYVDWQDAVDNLRGGPSGIPSANPNNSVTIIRGRGRDQLSSSRRGRAAALASAARGRGTGAVRGRGGAVPAASGRVLWSADDEESASRQAALRKAASAKSSAALDSDEEDELNFEDDGVSGFTKAEREALERGDALPARDGAAGRSDGEGEDDDGEGEGDEGEGDEGEGDEGEGEGEGDEGEGDEVEGDEGEGDGEGEEDYEDDGKFRVKMKGIAFFAFRFLFLLTLIRRVFVVVRSGEGEDAEEEEVKPLQPVPSKPTASASSKAPSKSNK